MKMSTLTLGSLAIGSHSLTPNMTISIFPTRLPTPATPDESTCGNSSPPDEAREQFPLAQPRRTHVAQRLHRVWDQDWALWLSRASWMRELKLLVWAGEVQGSEIHEHHDSVGQVDEDQAVARLGGAEIGDSRKPPFTRWRVDQKGGVPRGNFPHHHAFIFLFYFIF
jgi:hypothetical protein